MLNVVVRNLCVIVIGVLMVVLREAFMPLIIQFIGATFMVSGAIIRSLPSFSRAFAFSILSL